MIILNCHFHYNAKFYSQERFVEGHACSFDRSKNSLFLSCFLLSDKFHGSILRALQYFINFKLNNLFICLINMIND